MTRLVGWLVMALVPSISAVVRWHWVTDNLSVAGLILVGYGGAVAIARKLWERWQERIVDRVDRALGRWVSRFDRRYRAFMLSRLRFIDLRGLATVGFYTPELDEVFVDVSLVHQPPHRAPGGVLDSPSAVSPATDMTNRQSIGEFLDHAEPAILAVVGVPGSGKTTLLRHTARQVCRGQRDRRRTVPILLYLREHVTTIVSNRAVSLPELVRDTLERYRDEEPAGWFEQRLAAGACVVLLDGLDEVARLEDRQRVADWVERQIDQYPHNDYVITSRPHGYVTAPVSGARVLQVRSFTDDQVASFVRSWYLAVERHSPGEEGDTVRSRARSAAEDLLERLGGTPGLYDLTINPLLLTMIANVHRYRDALPGSRADLYGEICQVLLGRRQEAKRLTAKLGGDKKEVLLQGLAYAMMSQRVGDLPRAKVLDEIKPTLRRMSRDMTPEGFLDDVRGNGLLLELENGQYAFAHHTFQEYLAATHIRDNGLAEVLTNAVDDVWWRETTLLYAARSDSDPIVRVCLESDGVNALSLAFDCADQASQLDPKLRDQLDDLLDSAFTPDVSPERRRLMAAVLVTGHLRHAVDTSEGSSVCARPITNGIYWLYRQDTGVQAPDGPASTGSVPGKAERAQPVTGVHGTDAGDFARWVNQVTGDDGGYRLPSRVEIDNSAVQRVLAAPTRTPVLSVWLESGTNDQGGHQQPELWIPAAAEHPYTIDSATVAEHVVADVARLRPTVIRLLLLKSSVAVRVLAGILTRDLDRARARELARYLEIARELARGPELARTLAQARDHSRALVQARELVYARTEALALADNLELACNLALNVDPARELNQELVSALNLNLAHHVELEPVMGNALANALNHVIRENPPPATLPAEFSWAFLESTGPATTSYVISPESLAGKLDSAHTELLDILGSTSGGEAPNWALPVVNRLLETAHPIISREVPMTADSATRMRLAALCLAAEADTLGEFPTGDAFREIAAGVTLLERRSSGDSVPSESIILAGS